MSVGLIYKKISDVMKDLDAVSKNRETESGPRFRFRSIDAIYNELHPKLAKHGVFTVPRVLSEVREKGVTKTGTITTTVVMQIQYDFMAEDGSFVTAIVTGEATDTSDKVSNKAMATAHKYALVQTFAIPTEDLDLDAEYPEPIAEINLKSQIDGLVANFRKLAVTENQLASKFSLPSVEELNQQHIKELAEIGRSLVSKKSKVSDHFSVPNMAPGAK